MQKTQNSAPINMKDVPHVTSFGMPRFTYTANKNSEYDLGIYELRKKCQEYT